MLEPAGGWMRVLECFTSDHVRAMETCQLRSMVLLIDFDGKKDRMNLAKEVIPSHLTERVFVLGVLTEPEDLRKASLGSYETIGRAMAKDCREETDTTWGHDLLQHSAGEIGRLRDSVRPFLFEI